MTTVGAPVIAARPSSRASTIHVGSSSLPVSVGDGSAAALAFRRPTPKPCHLGRHAAFVDEDQVFGIKRGLVIDPSLAGGLYVGTLLLAGMRSLFLCVWP